MNCGSILALSFILIFLLSIDYTLCVIHAITMIMSDVPRMLQIVYNTLIYTMP